MNCKINGDEEEMLKSNGEIEGRHIVKVNQCHQLTFTDSNEKINNSQRMFKRQGVYETTKRLTANCAGEFCK